MASNTLGFLIHCANQFSKLSRFLIAKFGIPERSKVFFLDFVLLRKMYTVILIGYFLMNWIAMILNCRLKAVRSAVLVCQYMPYGQNIMWIFIFIRTTISYFQIQSMQKSLHQNKLQSNVKWYPLCRSDCIVSITEWIAQMRYWVAECYVLYAVYWRNQLF